MGRPFDSRRAESFWQDCVTRLRNQASTPFYLFSAEPIREALKGLGHFASGFDFPVRHWWSCKTHPLPEAMNWWQRQGHPAEVVSLQEYETARRAGFSDILINGPAKHRWLAAVAREGMRVNFDSIGELRQLLPLALRLRWRVGLRFRTRIEAETKSPYWPYPFGMTKDELGAAVALLRASGIEPEVAHLHLRTQMPDPGLTEKATAELAGACGNARWDPSIVNLGGGWPAPFTWNPQGGAFDQDFPVSRATDLRAVGRLYRRFLKDFRKVRELWLENGRWLTARSGILVVQIHDMKACDAGRLLICDGGRTMNALVSNWEMHRLWNHPPRRGKRVPTRVHGPTCMAFDCLFEGELPGTIQIGDRLLWAEAGAYHLPWETRFSHPLAEIWWHDGNHFKRVRSARK